MSEHLPFRNRLAFTQAKYTVLIALLLGFFFSVMQIFTDFVESKNQLSKEVDQLLDVMVQPASQATYSLDQEIAQDLLVGLFNYRALVEASIFDDRGYQIAFLQRAPVEGRWRGFTDRWFGATQTVTRPLPLLPPTLDFTQIGVTMEGGKMVVVVDTYLNVLNFLQRAFFIMLSGFLRNLILAGILLGFFHYYLTKPFVDLEVAIENLNLRNPEKYRLECPRGHNDNEFGRLVQVTNDMLVTIEHNVEERIEKVKETERLQGEISERKLREQKMQEYHLRLEASNQELQKTLDKLRLTQNQLVQAEKMSALGGLVAGVAHEINTPVGIGVTAASFMAEESEMLFEKYKKNEMTREDFEIYLQANIETARLTLSNLQRAANLIKSFKQMAVDQTIEEQREFLVQNYIEDTLLSLKPKLKRIHTIQIHSNESITMNSYPGSLSQVVTNLVMNSLIHAYDEGQSGRLTFDLSREGQELVFIYSDNGKGISKENITKIFNPFFTTKRGQGGTGLGLHLVYNLITQKLGGSIKCHSELGQGTTFIMRIPLVLPEGNPNSSNSLIQMA